MFTHPELAQLRRALAANPASLTADSQLVGRLIAQAEYALDCAALLDRVAHYPAEPYGEGQTIVAMATDGVNEIWNRHR